MPKSSKSRVLKELDEIRSWAEERNAKPACIRGTGGKNDVGMIRLDFPGYSGEQSLEEISWDDWFEKFEEQELALLVQDETASGEKSNFNKLVSSSTVKAKSTSISRRSATANSSKSEKSSPRAKTTSIGRGETRSSTKTSAKPITTARKSAAKSHSTGAKSRGKGRAA